MKLWLLLAGALWLLPAGAIAAPDFPALTGRVVDQVDLLSPEIEAQLTEKLAAQEAATTDQFVIVTLKSLNDLDIADYGYQLGRHWGIGQKDKNNGVLLIIAPNERAVRIEVGYGLEDKLTDATTSIIIQRVILPPFRNGDYVGGIMAGADAILQVLGGGTLAVEEPVTLGEDIPTWLIILIIIVFIIMVRRGGGGFGGFGGGGSGGGFRGFRGGGGSFGGGGSSGRW